MNTPWLTVVGIGEDGWPGLGVAARSCLEQARTIYGGPRHLAMLPDAVAAQRETWAQRMGDDFPKIRAAGEGTVVLATGDPLCYGVGAKLLREGFDCEEIRFFPAPSAYSLACARLGWSLPEVETLTVHGRPLEALHPHVQPGAKLVVLSWDGRSPKAIAGLLVQRGFGASRLTVLENMGGEREHRIEGVASNWSCPEGAVLNVVAVECIADENAQVLPRVPGLSDDAFTHDGQLTKREVRTLTLARLLPIPGQLLWDVGAGCGSVAIEWLRSDSRCRATAIERKPERIALIEQNATQLGVPRLQTIKGIAPQALSGLKSPDAVFIGGGLTTPGMLEACWEHLHPGGRLVANAVTLEGEQVLLKWQTANGGDLTRIDIAHAAPIGAFQGWRPLRPVTQLVAMR